ncbi:MAG: hypothetical protein JWO41_267 [Candidatus Saccharibacteria bacterium]|nr:hypothetical protein [Candidatus Saccharibacteria bacterium]
MTPEVTLGAIILVPVIIFMALRVNATLVFLSLCLGDVLVQFVAPDAGSFLAMFSAHAIQTEKLQGNNVSIGLLLLPVLLTTVFMIRTVSGKFKLALNLLPAVGAGLLGALLIVPLLPSGLSTNIINSSLWAQVQSLQNLIVGVSALICLLVLWLQRPKTGEGKHGKHHK